MERSAIRGRRHGRSRISLRSIRATKLCWKRGCCTGGESTVIARSKATKQSSCCRDSGLLRCARNDDVRRHLRHARPCAGHPRLNSIAARKTWMAGTSPAMTVKRVLPRVAPSRVAAVFAEQIELLLHRAVGETEQNRILLGLVGDPLPARHHEQVARAPLESLLADPRTTLALNCREYRGVGGAIARGLETLRQQLDEGADGRHREITGLGIGEFQLQAVAGVPFVPYLRL